MFTGNDITTLVEILCARGVYLYHACQFKDYLSYLDLGGIPSRAILEGSNKRFTAFETDSTDKANMVWDKVFVNLHDFGKTFADGHGAVPNPYGPILLKLRAYALLDTLDVAICLRSAGSQGFRREEESLRWLEQVERLFRYPATNAHSSEVKFGSQLRVEFANVSGFTHIGDPEISCGTINGLLSLDHVEVVIVDPYLVAGIQLQSHVARVKFQAGRTFPVLRRNTNPERFDLYDELARFVMNDTPSLSKLASLSGTSAKLKCWCEEVQKRNLEYQYRRYASYLREGTLNALLSLN
jgi:hypothetical protein